MSDSWTAFTQSLRGAPGAELLALPEKQAPLLARLSDLAHDMSNTIDRVSALIEASVLSRHMVMMTRGNWLVWPMELDEAPPSLGSPSLALRAVQPESMNPMSAGLPIADPTGVVGLTLSGSAELTSYLAKPRGQGLYAMSVKDRRILTSGAVFTCAAQVPYRIADPDRNLLALTIEFGQIDAPIIRYQTQDGMNWFAMNQDSPMNILRDRLEKLEFS